MLVCSTKIIHNNKLKKEYNINLMKLNKVQFLVLKLKDFNQKMIIALYKQNNQFMRLKIIQDNKRMNKNNNLYILINQYQKKN